MDDETFSNLMCSMNEAVAIERGDLLPFRETRYVSGVFDCVHCGNAWMAVYPEGAGRLECPRCRKFSVTGGFCEKSE